MNCALIRCLGQALSAIKLYQDVTDTNPRKNYFRNASRKALKGHRWALVISGSQTSPTTKSTPRGALFMAMAIAHWIVTTLGCVA